MFQCLFSSEVVDNWQAGYVSSSNINNAIDIISLLHVAVALLFPVAYVS